MTLKSLYKIPILFHFILTKLPFSVDIFKKNMLREILLLMLWWVH